MRPRLPFIAFFLCSPAFAGPLAGCDTLPKPSVTVRMADAPVSFDTTLGYRDLTSRAGEQARPGWQVLGLTQARAVAGFSLEMPSMANDQYECASPQITLTLSIQPLIVYVSREFPKGSCAYKEILDHEMRHVKAYQEHMAKVRTTFQEALTRRYATASVWRGPAGRNVPLGVFKAAGPAGLPRCSDRRGRVPGARAAGCRTGPGRRWRCGHRWRPPAPGRLPSATARCGMPDPRPRVAVLNPG